MSTATKHDLPVTPLGPHLLATPYQVQTNWHVITGAPCCGKSTIIDMLANLGYQTVAETARPYLEQEVAKGRTFAKIFDNLDDERNLKDLQLKTERALDPSTLHFLDRALPDILAFHRLKGVDPSQLLPICFRYRYASVFILDRLPLQLDSVRLDDNPMADYLDQQHGRDCAALGYPITRVPVLPPQDRLTFILQTLSNQGLL